MEKIPKILLVLLGIFLTFSACDDNNSSNDDNNSSAFTSTGSYWGTVTIAETEYNTCLVVNSGSIIFRSPYTAETYTNIKYTRAEDKTWSFAAYADEDAEQAGTAISSGSFSGNTCTAFIGSLEVTTDTLTLGEDYDDRWEDCTLSDFFGLYEGAITGGTIGGATYDYIYFVMYFDEDSACFYGGHSNISQEEASVDGRYSPIVEADVFLKYTFDSEEKTWEWEMWTTMYSMEFTVYKGTFAAEGTKRTTSAGESTTLLPATDTLTLGNGTYQGEYDLSHANYGSYWGTVDVNGTTHDICLVVDLPNKNDLTLSVKGSPFARDYTNAEVDEEQIGGTIEYPVTYDDETTGTETETLGPWSFTAKDTDDTVLLSGTFSVNDMERTVVLTFSDSTVSGTLTLGDDYNGEYDE